MLEPTDAEIITAALDARQGEIHTILPGKVVKYDKTKQVADVEPVIERAVEKEDGSILHERIPVIPNVPVVFPRGGGFRIIWDLVDGDHVVLAFSEAAIAQWRTTGQISQPGDLRRHDLSYPFAIPGAAPMTDPLDPPGTSEAVVDFTGATIRIGGPSADYVALANKVDTEIQKIWTLLQGGGSLPGKWTVVPNDGGAALQAAANALSPSGTAATKVKAE